MTQKKAFINQNRQFFLAKVMEVVNKASIGDRFYLQSFDNKIVKEIHNSFPQVMLGFLTGDKKMGMQQNLDALGFMPNVYSPHFALATPELVNAVQQKGMKFIPWTVNKKEDIKAMLDLKVDGIISDFPDRVKEIVDKKNK